MVDEIHRAERDLLVRVETKVDRLISDFEKLDKAVEGKASAEWVQRIDTRVAWLEKKIWMFAGGLLAAEAGLQWLLKGKP